MARTRLQQFLDGVSVSPPTGVEQLANRLENFANDAAFEAANGAGQTGDIYFNTTSQSIRIYADGAWGDIKAEDLFYNNATSGLTASTVQDAIDEVDANTDVNTSDIADIRTTTGTADGDTSMGTYTGALLNDNESTKQNIQQLETEAEASRTTSGTAAGATDMGTFTGATISDNVSTKTALQELETAHESTDSTLTSHTGSTAVHGVSEVMGTSGSTLQTVTYDVADDASTGIDITLVPTKIVTRLTSLAAGSTLAGIDTTNTKYLTLVNDSVESVNILNDSTNETTAAYRILTGTGSNLSLAAGTSLFIVYDNTESRWRVVGGSGSGLGDPMTTRGDIIVRDNSNTTNRLAVGARGRVLKSDGLDVAYGNQDTPVNLILNPDGEFSLDAGATDDIGDWIDSSTGTSSAKTTTASEIALEDIKSTGIKLTLASGTNDYTRIRFQVPAALQNQNLSLSWDQRVSGLSAQDMKVELYNYSDNYVSDVAEVALFSDDSSGDTYIAANDGSFKTAFSANGREYYELRFINNGGTSGYLSLNTVTVTNQGGANGAVVTDSTVVSGIPWAAGASGTTTHDFLVWRRVGEYMEGEIHFQQTGSGTGTGGGNLRFTIPGGLSVDSSKAVIEDGSPSTIQDAKFVLGNGNYSSGSSTTNAFKVSLFADSATEIAFLQYAGSTDSFGTILTTVLGNANNTISATFRIPILEWAGSGTVNLMDRGITQSNVKVKYTTTASQAWAGGNNVAGPWGTQSFADGITYNNSTGLISFPSGLNNTKFRIRASFNAGSTNLGSITVRTGSLTGTILAGVTRTPGSTSDATIEMDDVIEVTSGTSYYMSTVLSAGSYTLANPYQNVLSITRIADHSAIAPVGFGTSDEADTTAKYLLPRYQTQTVDISSSNNFSASNESIKFVRIGDVVTLTSTGVLAHASGISSASTASGWVPAEYRPSDTVFGTYYYDATQALNVRIQADGTFSCIYSDETGGVNRNDSGVVVSFSYVITG